MQYVRLGRTGLKVSRLCLGTATFGFQCDEPTSQAILDHAFDHGVTFVDTADKYPLGGTLATNGQTEEILGRWFKGRREQVIVATKVHGRMGSSAWDEGNSRKHILDSVEGSLRRLGVDYIDLYQLHRPDRQTPMEETLSALVDLVRAGKVRYIGCSNFLAYQVALALGCSEARRYASFVSVQPCYNLIFRQYERELLPLAREEGLAVLPYTTCSPAACCQESIMLPKRRSPALASRWAAQHRFTKTVTGTSDRSPSRRPLGTSRGRWALTLDRGHAM